ncbi:MAG TPA: hypothetical protein VHY22_11745 [Chthoniobacteraceae bacterium]|jgi:hypothetical protein|nr:hypothetical protein [Chthoniobacteraceae bacterium]
MSRFSLFRRLLVLAVLCAIAPSLHAQLDVRLDIPRHLFVDYEPIVATVSITNMTGRDITLSDQAPNKWFSFEIIDSQELPVPPRASDYHLDPLTIPMGGTVSRKVNLVNLYPVTDFGMYHARAVIFFAGMNQFFASPPRTFEVSEGQSIWQETVGIPDGEKNAGQYRTFQLLSFRQPKADMLYVRIQDKDTGIVYATVALGRLVNGFGPESLIDSSSRLHVLQMVAPREYLYTVLGPNAELIGQQDYTDLRSHPHLKRMADGGAGIAGGVAVLPETPQQAAEAGPKLSDRPAGMPGQ